MKDVLYGIKKVVLREIDEFSQIPTGANPIIGSVAEEASFEPVMAEGEEQVKRTDDKILAIVRTPDLCYGYDLTMIDGAFDTEFASLIEGGTIVKDETGKVIGYDSALTSQGITMKAHMLELYVPSYEGDSIKEYVRITFNNCKGTTPKLELKKEFVAPEYVIKAREASKLGLTCKQMRYVKTLPSDAQIQAEGILYTTCSNPFATGTTGVSFDVTAINGATENLSIKVVDVATGNDVSALFTLPDSPALVNGKLTIEVSKKAPSKSAVVAGQYYLLVDIKDNVKFNNRVTRTVFEIA